MKKLFSLLLVLCLIVGLLPVVASAAEEFQHDDTAKIRVMGKFDFTVTKGGEAKYARTTKNGEPQQCSETDDWNIKFQYVDDWAVLTLKGAQLGKRNNGKYVKSYMQTNHAFEAPPNSPCYQLKVVIEEDTYSEMGYSFINCQGLEGDPWITNVMIESVGDAKLTAYCGGATMFFCGINARGTLTINGNIDITNDMDYRTAVQLSAPNIVIKGGNVKLQSSNACISTTNLTIDGGNVTMSTDNGAVLCPANVPDGTITINGGNVKFIKETDGGGGAVKAEKFVVNGGNVYGEGWTYGVAASEVEFNGGVIELNARSDEGDAQAFIDGAPTLANFANAAAVLGISKEDVSKYDPDDAMNVETGYFKVAKAGTADAPEVPADEPEPTEPPATEPPATEPPATEPPATEPPATSGNNNNNNNDSNGNNNDSNGNNNDNNNNTSDKTDDTAKGGNSDWILWVVAGVFVVAAGVIAFIIVKKNAADDENEEE